MICDWDDFTPNNNRLDLLGQLKMIRPDFKCTVFAIPAHIEDAFYLALPAWIEVAMHGWLHGDPPVDGGECKDWTYQQMATAIVHKPAGVVKGFRAPGWQLSTDAMTALRDMGWWLADKPYNDDRRPRGLLVHRDGDGDHLHGHIQNVCGNGLEETFADVMGRVRAATSFEFMSEVVAPWNPR